MEQSEPILEVQCDEPNGPVIRSVRLCEFSFEKLSFLYNKLSEFDVLFNDYTRGDFGAFIRKFIAQDSKGNPIPRGLAWEVDDVGLLYLTDIHPGNTALGHFTFWDQRLRGREELIREMLRYVFDLFDFHSIRVEIPLYAPAALDAVERVGFVKEGRMRDAALYKGEWFDVNLYSILEDEVQDDE